MTKAILFLFVFIFALSVHSKINFDSLIAVIETSTDKADFFRLDSVLEAKNTEVNTISEKTANYIGLERSKTLNFEYIHAKFALRQSIIETIHGNLGEATRLSQEALHIFLKLNSIYATACYNTIASTTAQQGEHETAIAYMDKAFEILERHKSSPKYQKNLANNHLVLGYIYISDDNLIEGEKNIKKALTNPNKANDISTTIYCYLNLSVIEKKRKNYPLSMKYAEIALEICKANKSYNLEAVTNLKFAEIHEDMADFNAALLKYKQAEKIGLQQHLQIRLLTIYKAIYTIYKKNKNTDKAFEYQEKYVLLFEKQKEKEKEEQLQLLQIKFKVNEKVSKINSLATEKNHELERNKLLKLAIGITIAASILLIFILILIYNRSRLNREIQFERQEKHLSKHQLTALRSQMNPHFIFNALNSIQDLILKENTEKSYTFISKFADLVRKTLNHSNQEFIEIEEEFVSLKLYLELEELRFKGDLTIDFETNDIENIELPPLLIQPFIENALKHGLLHKTGAKRLKINFKLKEDLVCTISDNGIGRVASKSIQDRRSKLHPSFAVKSIEDRFKLLRQLYGSDLGITFIDLETDNKSVGTTVVLFLPFKHKL